MSAAARASEQPAPRREVTYSIGEVLKILKQDFPELTPSKIRFHETEGLIKVKRSPTGYRRFTEQDIHRLHRIFSLQKDNHLPLKVIRDRMAAEDEAGVTQLRSSGLQPMVDPEQMRPTLPARLTAADLADGAGVDVAFVEQMRSVGVVSADETGFYTQDDLANIATAHKLTEAGLDAQLLRRVRLAAQRQLDVIRLVAQPMAHSKDESAKERAAEFATELSAMVISLHAGLVKKDLRGEFG